MSNLGDYSARPELTSFARRRRILFVLNLVGFSTVDPSLQPIIAAIQHQLYPPHNHLALLPAPTPTPAAATPFLPTGAQANLNVDFLQQGFGAPSTSTSSAPNVATPLHPSPSQHFSDVPLDLGQLESDLAVAHGTDPTLSFMDGMGMEEWFSTAMLGGMGGELPNFGLEVPSFGAASSGGFEWGAGGGSGV